MTTLPPMPEHDKLAAVKAKHETIVEFIDWLYYEKGYTIVELTDNGGPFDGWGCERVADSDRDKAILIAQFLGIDHDAFLAEKDALLDAIRRGAD
jgi:hypothetical protein